MPDGQPKGFENFAGTNFKSSITIECTHQSNLTSNNVPGDSGVLDNETADALATEEYVMRSIQTADQFE